MADKIYCGSGKSRDTQYGEELTVSVNLTECTKWFKDYGYISKDGEKHFITLKLNRRKEVGRYGETHALTVDTWKPDNRQQSAPPAQSRPPAQRLASRPDDSPPDDCIPPDFPDDIPF